MTCAGHRYNPVKWILSGLLLAALSACAVAPSTTTQANGATLTSQEIAAVISSPDRSAADRQIDQRRQSEKLLALMGVGRGMVALDLSSGGGYTTELLARAVGPSGRVYGQSAPPRMASASRPPVTPEGAAYPPAMPVAIAAPSNSPPRKTAAEVLMERSKNPLVANIRPVVRPFEDPVPPEVAVAGLDLVTLIFNYHDLGHQGVDRARMNRAVFNALKPGGILSVPEVRAVLRRTRKPVAA